MASNVLGALLAQRAWVVIKRVANQKFAADLLAREVPLQQIERTIALGCSRKYVSLLNGTSTESISSLYYFRDLL
jgi:hypothetical protein